MWIAWCGVHSFLISRWAHSYADKILGRQSAIYRLLYVSFSLVSLIPVLWYQFSIPQQVILENSMPVLFLQAILIIYGLLMFYLGARVYDMRYFLGISQWQNSRQNTTAEALPFHTDGVLAYIRHPWYSAGIAIIWGIGTITDVYFVSRIILTGYFIIGTLLEEKRLKTDLGEPYKDYCRKAPMLIPGIPRS